MKLPALISVNLTPLFLPLLLAQAHQTGYIRLQFKKRWGVSTDTALIYVNDEDDNNIEVLQINVQYTQLDASVR